MQSSTETRGARDKSAGCRFKSYMAYQTRLLTSGFGREFLAFQALDANGKRFRINRRSKYDRDPAAVRGRGTGGTHRGVTACDRP